jgi:GINS complex subunit 3
MSRYLDIDLILSEEERLPVTFSIEALHLGHLDPSSVPADGGDTLPALTRTELPLWLAQAMASKNMVKMELPKHFGNKMRDEIMAGAAKIGLREYSHYFYEVGLHLYKATRDQDLLTILRKAFFGDRFRPLMIQSLTNYHDDVAEYVQTLTASELLIFNEGQKAASDLRLWRSRRASVLQKATILKRGSSHATGDDSGKRQRL